MGSRRNRRLFPRSTLLSTHVLSATPTLPSLEHVLARVDDVILITEAEPSMRPGPRIVFVNAAFERMTGYAAEEVIGQTPRLLQGPRTDAAMLWQLHTAIEQWQSTRVRVTNYRKNGIPFDVEFDITPIADNTGWYTHWVSIQRDITHSNVGAAIIAESESLEALRTGIGAELREYTGASAVARYTRQPGHPHRHGPHARPPAFQAGRACGCDPGLPRVPGWRSGWRERRRVQAFAPGSGPIGSTA